MQITKLGLGIVLERLIKILKNKNETCGQQCTNLISVPVYFENELRCVSISLTPMTRCKKLHLAGYHVNLNFDQSDSDDDNDDDTSNEAWEKLIYKMLKDQYYMYDKTNCLITVIDENLHQYNDKNVDAVEEIQICINSIIKSKLCQCQRSLIFDKESVCLTCCLSLNADDVRRYHCAICLETNLTPVYQTSCCHGYLHKFCLKMYKDKNNGIIKCPLCNSKDYCENKI